MTRKDLVEKYAKEFKCTMDEAAERVKFIFEEIVEELESGQKVSIVNFGTFNIVEFKEKRIHSPISGKYHTHPSKKVVRFKPSEKTAERVK